MTSKQDVLFISDLHLALEKPEITRRFLGFLQCRAREAKSLYILGDLFDAWIGDDDNTRPIPDIKKALREVADSGTAIFLLQGNRDFLLGQDFCQQTGIQLLDDYAVVELGSERVLLTHGDLLCSDDSAYQAFRIKSHSAEWQKNVLSKPLWLRLIAARWYRLRSYYHKRGKTSEIMDVNQDTVAGCMRDWNCSTLIHGHTHRPRLHEFKLDGVQAKRYVLAEWKPDGVEILRWRNNKYEMETV